jgi:hypothetical protein
MSGLRGEELLAADLLPVRVALDRAVLLDVALEPMRVEAFGVVEVSRVIADRDQGDAELAEEHRGVRADVGRSEPVRSHLDESSPPAIRSS